MRKLLLSDQGGDRATGYTMNNKIVKLPEGWLCTWLDVNRQNRWALVDNNAIVRQGTLGTPREDNHCGAALALAPDGTVHAIISGHHGALEHFRLNDARTGEWQPIATIDAPATYPSLVADHAGTLHLTFRHQRKPRWTLDYCTFRDGIWSEPRPLVVAQKPGYVYWTNALATGPNDRVHLAFANVRVLPDGGFYFGASHICSEDSGATWRDFGDGIIGAEPVSVEALALLEGEPSPDRIASPTFWKTHAEPGPTNREYLHMLLSNVAVDLAGEPHVVYHNGLLGTATLWSHTPSGWRAIDLTKTATRDASGYRIHQQSSLSYDTSGQLRVALMIEPTSECVWGPNGTRIVYLVVDQESPEIKVQHITEPDEAVAQWLPALEQPGLAPMDHEPVLLYTRGVNAGGFSANKNQTATEVWFVQSGN